MQWKPRARTGRVFFLFLTERKHKAYRWRSVWLVLNAKRSLGTGGATRNSFCVQLVLTAHPDWARVAFSPPSSPVCWVTSHHPCFPCHLFCSYLSFFVVDHLENTLMHVRCLFPEEKAWVQEAQSHGWPHFNLSKFLCERCLWTSRTKRNETGKTHLLLL